MFNAPKESLFDAAITGDVACAKMLLEKNTNPLIADSNGRIPLHFALLLPMIYEPELRNNKMQVAEELIKTIPASISCKDDSGDTPVHCMASGDFDTLLASALDFDPTMALLQNNEGAYPIHHAIATHQHRTFALLLTVPGMSELLDYRGRSLVHHAAMMNNLPVLEQLFEAHHHTLPHLHFRDDNDETALDIAIHNGFEQIANFLEHHGGSRSSFL